MALANLPSHYETVLRAKYMDEQSMETIAVAADLTIDAVKGRLKRARLAFKETFITLSNAEV